MPVVKRKPTKTQSAATQDFVVGKKYKCNCCGEEWANPVDHFYKSKWSKLWVKNELFVPICRNCIASLFEEYARRYKDERLATIICCHYLDVPFYHAIYDAVIRDSSRFSFGMYLSRLNGRQYQCKTFLNTLTEGEISKNDRVIQTEQTPTNGWSESEIKNRTEVMKLMGYDPFEGQADEDRRFLFNELIKYLEDDDIVEDAYKISQVIQIVNNNNQIRKCDILISSLNPVSNANDIKQLGEIKYKLVQNNDKIAKENEISVKNRSNKGAGKSTLTYLMRELREKNFKDAEVNYYDQLRSEGSLWAIEMSMRAIRQNAFFDENDAQEIIEAQRQALQQKQDELDGVLEQLRLLHVECDSLRACVSPGVK